MIIVDQPEPSDYRRISARAVRRIRVRCPRLGIMSILLSVALGIAVVLLGNRLSIAEHNPLMGFVIVVALATDLGPLISGIALFAAVGCVSTGYLDVNAVRKVRGLLLGMWVYGLLAAALSGVLVILVARGRGVFDPATKLYLLLPIGAIVLAGIAYLVARGLLRPTTGPGLIPGPGERR